jgi:hypothetical protein
MKNILMYLIIIGLQYGLDDVGPSQWHIQLATFIIAVLGLLLAIYDQFMKG